MSSLGGSDRKVSDFAIRSPAVWTPDGRYLVAGRGGPPDPASATDGIYLIPVAGGDARAITHPAPPAVDKPPAFSPAAIVWHLHPVAKTPGPAACR